ncbi:hypothetical protein EDB80DRAFT_687973 [Ilyonectria destructans]|nr:hypothetical protein EDB80DRAFT_687973 [Ilyonectria destructans]
MDTGGRSCPVSSVASGSSNAVQQQGLMENVIEDVVGNMTAASPNQVSAMANPAKGNHRANLANPRGETPMELLGGGMRKGGEAADAGGVGNHPKRRLGRPRTRTQAFVAGQDIAAQTQKRVERTATCATRRSARASSLERYRPGDVPAGTGGPGRASDQSRVRDNIDLECVLEKEEDEPGRQRRTASERDSLGQIAVPEGTPVPHERKVSTVQSIYKDFHNTETFPVCDGPSSPFFSCKYFPVGCDVLACLECARCLTRGYLLTTARLHVRLGYEHMLPDELKDLTPVEEKLTSLNSCYGFITKYSIRDDQRQGVTYPKHVKGYITVFPNNEELATKISPHPIVKVMDEIHVWHGARKPGPQDRVICQDSCSYGAVLPRGS